MKRVLLSTAVIVVLAVGGGYAYKAAADNPNAAPGAAPNAAAPNAPPAFPPPGPPGPWASGNGPGGGPGGWGPGGGPGAGPDGRGPGGPWGGWRHKPSAFSLFARVQNKNLSDADVKVIASAILLEHGNHAWSVANVATQADKSIDFSFATAHGDVIATFAVNPATGRIQRIS